ncbi:MAG TPA: DUF1707 domain-containing protein [Jiangellaceae bacterium]
MALPAYDPRQHPPQLRASDTEREAVAAHVRAAIDEGRLHLDELDDRLDAVYQARTHDELAKVIEDIVPVPPQPRPAPARSPEPGSSRKKILPAFVLGVTPFGLFGLHRHYAGQHRTGFAMMVLLLIGIGAPVVVFWWLYDLVVLALGRFEDGEGNIMRDWL